MIGNVTEARRLKGVLFNAILQDCQLYDEIIHEWASVMSSLKERGDGYVNKELLSLIERCAEIEDEDEDDVDTLIEYLIKRHMIELISGG